MNQQLVHPLGNPSRIFMRHERRSSPYVWPAIILFFAFASWLIIVPTNHQNRVTTAQVKPPTE
jgi:hypothetical protein